MRCAIQLWVLTQRLDEYPESTQVLLQSSHGEDTKYYDIGDRRRSPPRYERSILERLHKACPFLLSLASSLALHSPVLLANQLSTMTCMLGLQECHLLLATDIFSKEEDFGG